MLENSQFFHLTAKSFTLRSARLLLDSTVRPPENRSDMATVSAGSAVPCPASKMSITGLERTIRCLVVFRQYIRCFYSTPDRTLLKHVGEAACYCFDSSAPVFPAIFSSAISCVAAKGVSGMAKRRANGEGKLPKTGRPLGGPVHHRTRPRDGQSHLPRCAGAHPGGNQESGGVLSGGSPVLPAASCPTAVCFTYSAGC